jgi:hypothetical protein
MDKIYELKKDYGLNEEEIKNLTINEKRAIMEVEDIFERATNKAFAKALFNIIQGAVPAYSLQSEVLNRINYSYSEGETCTIKELAELGANNLYIKVSDDITLNIYDEDYSELSKYNLTPETEVVIDEIPDTDEGFTVIYANLIDENEEDAE